MHPPAVSMTTTISHGIPGLDNSHCRSEGTGTQPSDSCPVPPSGQSRWYHPPSGRQGPGQGRGVLPARPRTHAEHKVVVGLVVDLVQDIEHLDGKVRQCAEVGGDALLSLDVSTHRSLRLGVQAGGVGLQTVPLVGGRDPTSTRQQPAGYPGAGGCSPPGNCGT